MEERVKTGCSHRAVVSYTDLTDTAGTAKTLVLLPYIARDIFNFAFFDLVKTFDGGATSELTVAVGWNGATTDDADGLIEAKSIHEDATEILADAGSIDGSTTDTTFGAQELAVLNSLRARRAYAALDAGNIEAVFTATGANLTTLTQGLLHIYLNRIRPTEIRPLSAP